MIVSTWIKEKAKDLEMTPFNFVCIYLRGFPCLPHCNAAVNIAVVSHALWGNRPSTYSNFWQAFLFAARLCQSGANTFSSHSDTVLSVTFTQEQRSQVIPCRLENEFEMCLKST